MLYVTDACATDDALLAFLDFPARAHGERYWDRLDLRRPWVLGSADRVVLRGEQLEIVLASGVVDRREEDDRGVRHPSYSGRGVVVIAEEHWLVQGSSAHENRNHDFVSGQVTGHRVIPVEPTRCLALAERQDPQLALVLRYCAGQALFDTESSDAACEELLWRMPLLRWFDLQVEEVEVTPAEPFFVTLRGRVDAPDGGAFGGVVKDGRFALERIPRAGASALRGQTFTLPH